jgi:hypothetical protein
MSPQQVAEANPDLYPQGELPQMGEVTRFAPSEGGVIPTYEPAYQQQFTAAPAVQGAGMTPPQFSTFVPAATVDSLRKAIEEAEAPAPQEKGFFEGMSPQEKRNLALRAALGVGGGLLTGLQSRKATQQAQQAKQNIEELGRPYQETGKRLQEQALRGELTQAGQQQVQAAQAQLAQGAERRGGVGAQQAATQIAALRQNLLDQQYNYGLKVAQIGDSYVANAIRTGLTQDASISKSMTSLGSALTGFYGSQPNTPTVGQA